MCMNKPKAPKPVPVPEPLKNAPDAVAEAADSTARQQAMRRGLMSTWTRLNAGEGSAPGASMTGQATKLGG
jgi:hypothetical protein